MTNAIFLADTRPFLIGTTLLQIKENSDVFDCAIIYHQGLSERDKNALNTIMPCKFIDYKSPLPKELFEQESFSRFSPLMFARYEMFNYLNEFERVMWIDTDILIQKNINELIYSADKSGYAMITEEAFDNSNSGMDINMTNFNAPIYGYNMIEKLYCSALIVVNKKLQNHEVFSNWCYEKTLELAKFLNLPDQGILNLLIQEFKIDASSISSSKYALYPKLNKDCSEASILHSWGLRKFWNSWYLSQKFPKWNEYYQKWIGLGGSVNPQTLEPDISVVIPAYKPNLEFMQECLSSLYNQKRKGYDYDNFEIIIVAEPFNTEELKAYINSKNDPRIKLLINETRLGISASLNRGIKEAKAKYIARLDDDDIAHPYRLAKQLETLEANPNIDLCTSNYYYFGDMNEGRKILSGEESKALSLLTCPFDHPTVMFRKEFFVKNNLSYDESRFFVEDWDLWCRAFDKGMQVKCIDEFLLLHRWYNGQAGQNCMTGKIMELQRCRNIFNKFGIEVSLKVGRDLAPYSGKLKKIKIPRLIISMSKILFKNLFVKAYSEKALFKVLLWRLKEALTGRAISKKLKTMNKPSW